METILEIILEILQYMIVGGRMVVGVWVLALGSIFVENRFKRGKKW